MDMDIIAAARSYIDRIVSHKALRKESNVGKVLILDAYTTQVVANVFSQTQILENDFYLVEQLGSDHEPMPHLKAAVFVRPTAENVAILSREFADPQFKEYHLFFSNILSLDLLQALAESDEHEVVKQVQEFYGDFIAVNEDLFTLNMGDSLRLSAPSGGFDTTAIFDRTAQGLLSVLLSMKVEPSQIRYQGGSQMAQRLAVEIDKRIQGDGIFHFTRQEGPMLLILDRKCDPVTPLLSQWTYQAMVHELLGLNNNRVVLKGAPNVSKEMEEVVLSSTQDAFFAQQRHANFGDLAGSIKELLDDFQKNKKLNENITSVEDMQSFMERYPAFRSQSHNVSKHVALMTELSRLVNHCSLMDVSQLEQDLACNDEHSSQFKELMSSIRAEHIKSADKLRLAILYALRYEEMANVAQLKRELIDGGVPQHKVDIMDVVLQYAGKAQRAPGLYGDRSFMSRMAKNLQTGLNGVENVYTQHQPLMMGTLDAAIKGKLRESAYPAIGPIPGAQPRSIVVFIVGGATYEEGTKVAEMNASNPGVQVLLGGNTIHNSVSFLEELKVL